MIGPVAFQRAILGRTLCDYQKTICSDIDRFQSVSIKGCHGSGKTYTVAGVVPYELMAHEESIVLTIAPTLRQVKLMWNEIETAILSMPVPGPERTTTGWQLSEKCYAQGFSSSKGVNAQGFHGKRVLIIADEAIGITTDIWDAVEGIRMAGDVRIVKMCNPTVPGGPVFDDFTKHRNRPGHKCITISAFDTPNLKGLTVESLLALPDHELDYAPFPMLARRRAVVDLYHRWGPNSPRFCSRVLGQFPSQAADAVFELAWIEKAALPYDDADLVKDVKFYLAQGRGFIQIGLDVAGPGDAETSATARIGPYVIAFEAWVKPDPFHEFLKFVSRLYQRFPGVPVIVMADVVGIGYHFARAIARENIDVREFMAGDPALNPRLFQNAKADAYFQARELMRSGDIRGVIDEDTKAQLSDIRYRELPRGTVEIEHKDEAKARGSVSPDRAESLIMAFARLVPKVQTFTFGKYEDQSPY